MPFLQEKEKEDSARFNSVFPWLSFWGWGWPGFAPIIELTKSSAFKPCIFPDIRIDLMGSYRRQWSSTPGVGAPDHLSAFWQWDTFEAVLLGIPMLGREPSMEIALCKKIVLLGAVCLLEWSYRWAGSCFPQLWSCPRPTLYRGKDSSAMEVAYPLTVRETWEIYKQSLLYVAIGDMIWTQDGHDSFRSSLICSEKVQHAFPSETHWLCWWVQRGNVETMALPLFYPPWCLVLRPAQEL